MPFWDVAPATETRKSLRFVSKLGTVAVSAKGRGRGR